MMVEMKWIKEEIFMFEGVEVFNGYRWITKGDLVEGMKFYVDSNEENILKNGFELGKVI